MLEQELATEKDDVLMRLAEREMQEAQRIEDRLDLLVEAGGQRQQRRLGGLGAIGVTAHPVHGNDQGRVLTGGDADAILIVTPVTDQADL